MPLGGNDLNVLHADAAQFAGHEVGGFLHIGFVLFQRADAGDAEKILQFAKETLLMIAGKINRWGSHNLILSGERDEKDRKNVSVYPKQLGTIFSWAKELDEKEMPIAN